MTTEELWNNLKVILERQENDIKEIKAQMKNLLEEEIPEMKKQIAEIPKMKAQIENLVEKEIPEIKEQIAEIPEMKAQIKNLVENEIPEIKTQIHNIKDVNLVTIIKNQTSIMEKLDEYIKQNDEDHKKFEYRIANLEWKNRMAN